VLDRATLTKRGLVGNGADEARNRTAQSPDQARG
jgi:hypothetical protein